MAGNKRNRSLGRVFFILATVFAISLEILFRIPHQCAANTGDPATLHQFTSGGHVLGFGPNAVFVASRDHMLRVEMKEGRLVSPVFDEQEVDKSSQAAGPVPLTRVTYPEVWDGITVVYEKCAGGIVKSTYHVTPGAGEKPWTHIRLRYNRPVQLASNGDLVISYNTGEIVEKAPVAWQEVSGKRMPVTVAYALSGKREVGFTVRGYDPGHPLVIDPVMTWNTFLGGSGSDLGSAIAVDGDGNVYVAGDSSATWGSPVRAYTSSNDAFAAKLASDGSLTWNTFLGGSGTDYGYGIAVDRSGNVYVAGQSSATWGSPVRAYTSSNDAFGAKLASDGSLTWNTFLGGSGVDYGYDIAVDGSRNVYVAGRSSATWGSPVRAYTSGDDAFGAKLASDGSLTWNTFLGGSGGDYGTGIAVDGSGNVYVAGFSYATWGSPVRAYTSGDDAFGAKLASDGSLTWNTFLGGSGGDYGTGIAVDGSGNAYVAGFSNATWGSPVRAYTSGDDAFGAKLASDGSLTWNTFLGGSGVDYGNGIAVDGSRNVYVGGNSNATWGSPVRAYTSGNDAFAVELPETPTLVELVFLDAASSGNGVVITWETVSEIDSAGFHIHRSAVETSGYRQITNALIPAEGSPTQGATYRFNDQNVEPGKTYYYKLVDVGTSGIRSYYGPVSATVQAAIPTMTDTGLIVAGLAFLAASVFILRKRRKENPRA